MISPRAQSFAVNMPRNLPFINNIATLVRQTISYDTISAAFAIMQMISIVPGCVSQHLWVHATHTPRSENSNEL